MNELINQLYEEFKGIGSPAIVRNGQKNDAFELVVLKILYGRLLDLTFDKEHIEEIQKYIIAPPDAGIDIFIEKGDGDDSVFDIIQVKNKELTESELRDAFSTMERTVRDFCKSPINISSENCREILSKSSLDNNNKKNCSYFVVHTGNIREFHGMHDYEHVINLVDLQILSKSKKDKVEEDTLSITGEGGYMPFGKPDDNQSALICNINGYDLATLNNKYYSTEIGRNILFGHNLREQLNPKTSKSYTGMKKTVKECPKNFWYYNNGITIVAEEVEPQKNGDTTSITLRRFSVVNGAQTTSSLGLILQEAERNRDDKIKEALKQTYVIARILKVNDPDTENCVAIYNNTQNPITSRDMVANNEEQRKLYDRLIDTSYPQIYMEIRRGSKIPQSFNKSFVHRKTSNETLAQLAYAGYFLQPFTAKDKKAALFNNDISQTQYTMNEIYHRIFHLDPDNDKESGVLFRKTKNEIDELLFTQELYKEGKTYLKNIIQDRLDLERKQFESETDSDQKIAIQTRIDRDSSMLEAIGICMFYYITTYYEFDAQYGSSWKNKRFDFEKFYQDKSYRKELVADFADFFLVRTIQVLLGTAKENGKAANINNWVRSLMCQTKYLEKLRADIGYDMNLSTQYDNLMNKYKVVPQ
ncbi:AIPR protein [Lachnospiraceae bacterium]|nr:AIPR protein [Lachnospiraceae bacterium]